MAIIINCLQYELEYQGQKSPKPLDNKYVCMRVHVCACARVCVCTLSIGSRNRGLICRHLSASYPSKVPTDSAVMVIRDLFLSSRVLCMFVYPFSPVVYICYSSAFSFVPYSSL